MPRPQTTRHAIDISEADGVRYLHFGSGWIQGAMRIARPWSLELPYTRDMMFGLLLTAPSDWPRSILQIGLGAASLTRFIYRHLPAARQTVVEINPSVEVVASQYFKLPQDPLRLRIEHGCGADYLLAGEAGHDLILVDGFDPAGRMGALGTLPFLQAVRARLRNDGYLAINLLGRDRHFAKLLALLKEAFEQNLLILPSCDSGNVVVLARHPESAVPHAFAVLEQRAAELRQQTRLDLRPTLKALKMACKNEELVF
ncbi:MAG: fused MFS/spermidine synthase [Azonexus sp.]|nr:fused MFS/spermidine synthase [Azonexus sp.]MCK6413358.1 fused MFS/spermidine synthase [Azonexus sp.]